MIDNTEEGSFQLLKTLLGLPIRLSVEAGGQADRCSLCRRPARLVRRTAHPGQKLCQKEYHREKPRWMKRVAVSRTEGSLGRGTKCTAVVELHLEGGSPVRKQEMCDQRSLGTRSSCNNPEGRRPWFFCQAKTEAYTFVS